LAVVRQCGPHLRRLSRDCWPGEIADTREDSLGALVKCRGGHALVWELACHFRREGGDRQIVVGEGGEGLCFLHDRVVSRVSAELPEYWVVPVDEHFQVHPRDHPGESWYVRAVSVDEARCRLEHSHVASPQARDGNDASEVVKFAGFLPVAFV